VADPVDNQSILPEMVTGGILWGASAVPGGHMVSVAPSALAGLLQPVLTRYSSRAWAQVTQLLCRSSARAKVPVEELVAGLDATDTGARVLVEAMQAAANGATAEGRIEALAIALEATWREPANGPTAILWIRAIRDLEAVHLRAEARRLISLERVARRRGKCGSDRAE
jgi:hypothetical protein